MALRLHLVPHGTKIDFFRHAWATFGASVVATILSLVAVAVLGLNYGIDFKGGTTVRTESTNAIDVSAYRTALEGLNLGDVTITEVFDPAFRPDQHVAQVRIEAQGDSEVADPAVIDRMEEALKAVDPAVKFTQVESVGPKVSGELIWTAFLAVGAASLGIGLYIWMRFEWQYAVGAVAALIHDVVVTVGLFSVLGLKFDLTTVAALLTIMGFSMNDTVVVFDRLRENLQKYKTMPLRDVMNLSVNETLGRTLMTVMTTLLALIALIVFGGDVLRTFVIAITWGIIVGTYSSIYMAKNIVLFLGLPRGDKPAAPKKGGEFANIDA
ncbi:MAG: protein translocase subunit SecF [Paracoccaceae bacterium]